MKLKFDFYYRSQIGLRALKNLKPNYIKIVEIVVNF